VAKLSVPKLEIAFATHSVLVWRRAFSVTATPCGSRATLKVSILFLGGGTASHYSLPRVAKLTTDPELDALKAATKPPSPRCWSATTDRSPGWR
jgi:hypothetical protein